MEAVRWFGTSAALAGALATLAACDGMVDGSFRLRFDSAQAEMAALTVHVRIRRGSCRSPGEVVHEDRFFAAERGATPPTLDEGRYAIWAEARTGGCIPVAQGCSDVELPDDADILLTMADVSEPVFDEASTAACEGWLARRRVVTDVAPPAASEQDAGLPAGDAGVSAEPPSAVMATAGDPAVSCEESCSECAAQWRCCDERMACGCTVVPGLCWPNISDLAR